MKARVLLWPLFVFALTLVAEWPARWLAAMAGLPAQGVSGSLWHGEAAQVGDAGALKWQVQPWRLRAQMRLGYQGQDWQLQIAGWPWRWHAQLAALEPTTSVAADYRLAGHWQGRLDIDGAWRRCQHAAGRLQTQSLALVAPWSMALGEGWLQLQCDDDWRVQGALALAGQHRVDLEAFLGARRGRLTFAVQPQAALTPLLRGAQWLGPEASSGERQWRW